MPINVRAADLARLVEPGRLVYVPGASGAPTAFLQALHSDSAHSRDLRLLTSCVPGINPLSLQGLHPSACVSGLFMQPALAAAQREGRYRALPMTYAGFVRHLQDLPEIDLVVLQLSPPDAQGRCSLGPAVEFMPVALRRARRVLGLVNPRVPRVAGAPTLAWADLHHVCEVDDPLPTYDTPVDAGSEAIARHVAALLPEGCTLQLGLGKVPAALCGQLGAQRGLRFHSGLLSDGLLDLHEAGALDESHTHLTCVLVGTQRLYDECGRFSARQLRVAGCDETHDLRRLLDVERFVAVNAALEVDLFGQANLEHAGGAAVSGAGGAPDFARAARLSHGGLSVVALPATAERGRRSRIVPALAAGTPATLARTEVDVVVTEHGAARLRGLDVHQRARALIDVAAPEQRAALDTAWQAIAARL